MQSKIYLSDKDLAARYGVFRGTIWRWLSEGRLPHPVHVGPNTTRWRLADIEQHDQQFATTAPAGQASKTPAAPR
jgi:predicted DNA-binding transcriptional regulator AlpA